MSFAALGLCAPLLRIIEESGYTLPTPIQSEAIPAILDGRDVMAAAQTGTGKTAGFALPLLQRLADNPGVASNQVRVLVLTPTRELAIQVAESFAHYGRYLPLKSGVVYGGVKINPQMMRLRGGLDVLVATPGRLLDLFAQNAVKFTQLEALVLDEADRMLDLGFSLEIGRILALLPNKRQNLLFSATFSDEIRKLADPLLSRPLQLEVNPRNSAAATVEQLVFEVDKSRKPALLSHLVLKRSWEQVLVFVRTRKGADQLVQLLERDGISSVAIHGDKHQNERSRALARFKANRVRVLVATDVAARGLDINELPYVVNFDLPKVAQDYIHRIGRTGRAGTTGLGISLVSADEVKLLAAIEGLLHLTLLREVVQGFVPEHKVPLSQQARSRPNKEKKAKPQKEQTAGNKSTAQKKQAAKKPSTARQSAQSKSAAKNTGGRGRRRS